MNRTRRITVETYARNLFSEIDARARRVNAMLDSVQAEIDSCNWQGDAATSVTTNPRHTLTREIAALQSQLDNARCDAERNATRQLLVLANRDYAATRYPHLTSVGLAPLVPQSDLMLTVVLSARVGLDLD